MAARESPKLPYAKGIGPQICPQKLRPQETASGFQAFSLSSGHGPNHRPYQDKNHEVTFRGGIVPKAPRFSFAPDNSRDFSRADASEASCASDNSRFSRQGFVAILYGQAGQSTATHIRTSDAEPPQQSIQRSLRAFSGDIATCLRAIRSAGVIFLGSRPTSSPSAESSWPGFVSEE